MQAPGTPPPAAPGAPATSASQRSGPPWGKIIGFGCAGCGCLSLLLAVILFFVFRGRLQKTPLSPSQQAYVGDWRGAGGASMTIRADGSGDLHAGSLNVTNGQVTINDSVHTLRIAFGAIGKTYRIDSPPSSGSPGM